MASNDAARARILAHMNKDHVYDTKLYLVHYLSYPKSLLRASHKSVVALSDIQATHLTISVDGTTKQIPLTPPMASLSDARIRLVDMTKQAESALGINRETVDIDTTWIPPRPHELLVSCSMAFIGYMLFFPSTLLPGGLLHESTPLKSYPDIAGWIYNATPFGYWTFVTFHIVEALYFVTRVLGPCWAVPGVSLPVATLWLSEVLLQGYLSFVRWDRMIEQQKTKRKARTGKKEH
ncbi:hypothetical protein Dda_4311 [Drechslerella dactyloides]|uniref:DUF2470 domain-containing protein n=1 Tax=Drechslerella dactyloides TaxID=74499 RepID=A0AAD6IWN0_DREDA|nr:hypothetical protein Dda_4311 [Drechslerella dactyloides]